MFNSSKLAAAKLRKCGRMLAGGVIRASSPKPIFADSGELLVRVRRVVVRYGKARVLS